MGACDHGMALANSSASVAAILPDLALKIDGFHIHGSNIPMRRRDANRLPEVAIAFDITQHSQAMGIDLSRPVAIMNAIVRLLAAMLLKLSLALIRPDQNE